ncbi:hypothetical protein CAter282_3883 [Collimonas arenae]|uniref:Uncharacterized protein n=1 Tax=Collimonas arenae TaxID=279058 RepID=A0A127PV85_9BURK|nr:hypothetical protein CAter10_4233 [Collimonas arenae]AMP11556.1 hypothetical protein CAter282_3883 [Collimonas arenae]
MQALSHFSTNMDVLYVQKSWTGMRSLENPIKKSRFRAALNAMPPNCIGAVHA